MWRERTFMALMRGCARVFGTLLRFRVETELWPAPEPADAAQRMTAALAERRDGERHWGAGGR